jgi:hypothetical protein
MHKTQPKIILEMHSHRVAQGMDRARFDAGGVGILGEQLLHLALLQGSLVECPRISSTDLDDLICKIDLNPYPTCMSRRVRRDQGTRESAE